MKTRKRSRGLASRPGVLLRILPAGLLSGMAQAAETTAEPMFGSLFLGLLLAGTCIGLVLLNFRLRREIAEHAVDASRFSEAAQQYYQLIEAAPFPLVIVNAENGHLLYVNKRTEAHFGVTNQEVVGTQSLNFYAQREDGLRLREKLDAEGSVIDFEAQLRITGGKEFWAYVSAAFTEYRGIRAIFFSFNDITERKLTETQLNRIIDKGPIPMMLTDTQMQRIERVNRRFEESFGYPAEQIAAIDAWRQLAYPDPVYRQMAEQMARDVISVASRQGGVAGPYELKVHCANHSVKDIEFRFVDLGNQYLWSMNDITAHNEAEDAVMRANDNLLAQLGQTKKLQAQLREQTIRDPLTGLFNRRYLDETMEHEIARARRDGYPLSVIMLDIDHFKRLNDTYGHPAGDEVLKTLGELLLKCARSGDIACRYGGEEFILILPRMPLDTAVLRANDWREQYAELSVHFGDFVLTSTLSAGVATFPAHGANRDSLIEAADRALYAAKHHGRNRVESATTSDTATATAADQDRAV